MAVEIKVSPDEKLELVQTYLIDPSPTSEYFNITELSDTFSGGKNAFLIAGSELLNPNTEIKVQVKDSEGNPLYLEFANGTPEYYEGISKVVAVYVYPTETAFGPAKITILGEIKDAPDEWKGKYNVKWERTININPALPNTTKVRFYKRPTVSIKETLEPIYRIESGSKVPSNVTASFADVKISQLETFAGDVKRVKVFRTSEGDISDYDLIQDILIESKELLITYDISGSVKGEAGLFTADTITKAWNTGSLNVFLTGSRVENGCRVTGSGNFVYTSSLNLNKNNKYEFSIDAFYSASTVSNLGIYLSGSQNGIYLVGKLSGSVPTKNLLNSVISFSVPNNEPTASLYLSQSQGEWHIGNLSLKLSEDTAFSPNEISFVTSMPTVIGNETYTFKFEFYDVNNNYIPIAVTQSALFTGGNNNVGGTLTLISGSITEFSQSYFEDVYSGSNSITGSITFVSSSVSSVSASISGTIATVSSSVSGTISNVSSSLSSSISTSLSESKAYTDLISKSVNLEFGDVNSRIFTDSTGLINKAPSNGVAGLYLGQSYLGFHNGNGQVTGWKTFMANNGNFFLTSSNQQSGYLAWDSAASTLVIKGAIDITGGTAQTEIQNAALSGSNAFASASSYSASLSSSISASSAAALEYSRSISASTFFTTNLLDTRIFTDSTGKINRTPTTSSAINGLYLGSQYMGYYSGSSWRTYMDNLGKFYLTGSLTDGYSNYLTWDGAGNLVVAGAITITGGNAATQTYAQGQKDLAIASGSASATAVSNSLAPNIFTDAKGKIVRPPLTGSAGLFLGSSYLGYYDATDWKTYMASNGDFYLTGSNAYLKWFPATGTLQIKGSIDITGGDSLTQIQNAASSGSNALSYAVTNNATASAAAASQAATNANNLAAWALQNANTASINSLDDRIFTNALGRITKAPTTGVAGLFLGSSNLGYHNGSAWKTYMDNTGLFYLTGSAGGNALLWDGANLIVKGQIKVSDGTEVTSATLGKADSALQNNDTNKTLGLSGGSVGGVTIAPSKIYIGTGTWGNTNTGFYVDSGGFFSLKNKLTWDTNNLSVTGEVTADSGVIGGWTIGSNKIYRTNKIELDAGAANPGINVYGSDNQPRVIINNSDTLSSLTGGGAGSGNYPSTNGGVSNSGTTKYFTAIDMPTVAGAIYSLTITITESDSSNACNFSPIQATGTVITNIDIWNNALTVQGQNVFYEPGNTVSNQTFWTWSLLGGINGLTATVNVVGDGTTLKIRPRLQYSGTASQCKDLTFPAFSYSWLQSVSKTEIIPGGMQVVNSTAAYLKLNRAITDSPSTPWITSLGNWSHNGVLITNSDRSIKNNIIPIDFNLEKLNEIDGYSYDKTIDYDNDGNPDTVISTYGIIAQEIESIIPNAVSTNAETGIKGVDYNAVTGMLVSAVKKLYKKVVELETIISGSK